MSNGFFALEYCEHTNYDVMMVQHGDKEMEGDALIRILRNIGNSIPLILLLEKDKAASLLSKADEQMLVDQQISLEPGNSEFDATVDKSIQDKGYGAILYKPYSSKRLCESIRKALAHGNSLEAIKRMAGKYVYIKYIYMNVHEVHECQELLLACLLSPSIYSQVLTLTLTFTFTFTCTYTHS